MKKVDFWILLGPGLLLAATLLLFYKAAFLLARPVWLCGLGISIFLASGICYLIFKEVLAHETILQSKHRSKEREASCLREVLEEAQHLYREKVDQLEETIASIEIEQQSLHQGYEELFKEANVHKNHLTSYQASLDDALDELRELRKNHFLEQEREKRTPKDLLNQHQQLRQQFEEKSLILDQTRRRLFMIEGHLIALKKEQALEKLDASREDEKLLALLIELEEENQHLEEEVAQLEQLVAMAFKPARTSKSSKKPLETMLELQFDSQ